VDRQTILWSLVAFFGASIVFRAIQDGTDLSTPATVALELVALGLIIGLVVLIVRRRGR
jgi:hypothetical protein